MTLDLTKEQIYNIKNFMAFVLRHKPYLYHIKLDVDGYASLDVLARAIIRHKKIPVTKEQLIEICKRYSGGIFVIKDDSVKAKDGHTVTLNMHIPDGYEETTEVPQTLYCILDKDKVGKILVSGNLTLPDTKVVMHKVQMFQEPNKSIVTIHASKALADSTKFYYNSKTNTYYARVIAARYLSVHV